MGADRVRSVPLQRAARLRQHGFAPIHRDSATVDEAQTDKQSLRCGLSGRKTAHVSVGYWLWRPPIDRIVCCATAWDSHSLQVAADGHCLFNSVLDQLRRVGQAHCTSPSSADADGSAERQQHTHRSLRILAANYLRTFQRCVNYSVVSAIVSQRCRRSGAFASVSSSVVVPRATGTAGR